MNGLPPLPEAFVARMRQQLGTEAEAFFAALEAPALRGLRLNPRKPLPAGEEPQGLGDVIPWEPRGHWLSPESQAGAHPLHEAGAYYLQEPSAMLPARVLAPEPGETVLDLCAAPGGKSTQLGDMLGGQGLLVCNEPVPSRSQVLSRNLERMGLGNALAVCADPAALARAWPRAFDAVLVDAPCSGEGMFRRHPETRLQWTPSSPAGCAARQRRILASAYELLKPGGRLVYSTCTFSPEENRGMIRWFRETFPDMEPVEFSVPLGEGRVLASREGMVQMLPHQFPGEGHFVAKLRKGGESEACDPREAPFLDPAQVLRPASPALLAAFVAFLGQSPDASQAAALTPPMPIPYAMLGDTLLCSPPLPPLQGIKVLRAGLHLGGMKGKVFMPDHALALGLPSPSPFPSMPLTLSQAQAYQRGEALPLEEAPRGYALAAYQGLALGWGKGSDGQFKNHYPKGLRRP